MKMIASRQLAARPGQVWGLLEKEGSVVITKDGKPRGLLLPTADETLVEDIQCQIQARAQRAVSQMHREAARRGLDRLTMSEIDAEIAAARRCRTWRCAA
ncbi:MAG: type II toxin-antitoxin system Phd/YefM family antitoxin [Verrucomicrobia bacterium]|nr:type II toxin-antitoxin system Phd/YefM family antitoxin [Verrucomicrobiota bacterium]